MREISDKKQAEKKKFNKHWEYCVGSGHAPLAMRTDYMEQLKRVKNELGMGMDMEVDIIKNAENFIWYEKDANGYIYFRRFLEKQKQAYEINAMYRNAFYAGTGICICFQTNGNKISCECNVKKNKNEVLAFFTQPTTVYQLTGKAKKRKPPKSIRNQLADREEQEGFELLIDGKHAAIELAKNHKLEFQFANPEKKKVEICIYLPQRVEAGIRNLFVNGEVWECRKKQEKILAAGDSITAGFRSQYSSNSYLAALAGMLSREIVNQGVPGYTFYRDSLSGLETLPFRPAMFLVAYGTNDWNYAPDKNIVNKNIQEYFFHLNKVFPDVPKVVITPIWRADEEDPTYYGSIKELRDNITTAAEKKENTLIVPGERLLPHELKYLRDGYVHPNDEGHKLFAENLLKCIQNNSALLEKKGVPMSLSR